MRRPPVSSGAGCVGHQLHRVLVPSPTSFVCDQLRQVLGSSPNGFVGGLVKAVPGVLVVSSSAARLDSGSSSSEEGEWLWGKGSPEKARHVRFTDGVRCSSALPFPEKV